MWYNWKQNAKYGTYQGYDGSFGGGRTVFRGHFRMKLKGFSRGCSFYPRQTGQVGGEPETPKGGEALDLQNLSCSQVCTFSANRLKDCFRVA